MNQEKAKMMILADVPECTQSISEILNPFYDLTVVKNSAEATQKASKEKFDLILTDYIVPQLQVAEKAAEGIKNANERITEAKTGVIEKCRTIIHNFKKDVEVKGTAADKNVRESQKKYDTIVKMIQDQIAKLEEEKYDLESKYQQALKEKDEMLIKAEAAASEKTKAVENMEKALDQAEKAKAEKESALGAAEKAAAETQQALTRLEDAGREIKGLQTQAGMLEKNLAEAVSEKEKVSKEAEKAKAEVEKALDKAEKIKAEKEAALGAAEKAASDAKNAIEKLEGSNREIEGLQTRVKNLEKNLEEAVSLSEITGSQKKEIEQKFQQLQEQWENLM